MFTKCVLLSTCLVGGLFNNYIIVDPPLCQFVSDYQLLNTERCAIKLSIESALAGLKRFMFHRDVLILAIFGKSNFVYLSRQIVNFRLIIDC